MPTDRIEWLYNFNSGMNSARSLASSVAYIGAVMLEAGNETIGRKLLRLSEALDEALEKSDKAISKMIADDVKESFRRTDQTFIALLKGAIESDAIDAPREQ